MHKNYKACKQLFRHKKTIKYKRSQSFDKNKKDSEKMSDAGYFILLFSANIFLTQDFEYCA